MWNKFVGMLLMVLIYSRIPFLWYRVYRFFFQKKYNKVPLNVGLDIETTDKFLKTLTWRADGWKELGDSLDSPHFVQYCINQRQTGADQPSGALDCDDFSTWAAYVLKPEYHSMIFSVSWANKEKPKGFWKKLANVFTRFNGHAMCMTYDNSTNLYTHISNWGISRSYPTLEEHVQNVLTLENGELLAWQLFTKEFKLIKVSRKLK